MDEIYEKQRKRVEDDTKTLHKDLQKFGEHIMKIEMFKLDQKH